MSLISEFIPFRPKPTQQEWRKEKEEERERKVEYEESYDADN